MRYQLVLLNSNGIVFYGTKEDQTGSKKIGRLYRANLRVADDLYVLGDNQLIKEWDADGIDNSPKEIYNTRDSIYVGIKNQEVHRFLWRYYLPTAGYSKILQSCCRWNNRKYK